VNRNQITQHFSTSNSDQQMPQSSSFVFFAIFMPFLYNLTTQCCVVHSKPSNFHTELSHMI